MEKYIITIARQYGSGGREIGKKLSEVTGFRFYDKDLITMAAQKSGLSQAVLDTADEKAANSLLYTLALGSSVYHHGVDSLHVPLNDKLFTVQSEIIKELAERNESAIIVGRCADYVLRDEPSLFRLFIYGDTEHRKERIASRHPEVKSTQVLDVLNKTDRRRSYYYNFYTGNKWGKFDNYDMAVNSSTLGIDGCADLIVASVRQLMEERKAQKK